MTKPSTIPASKNLDMEDICLDENACHPLIRLLVHHCRETIERRDGHADLSPASFNREFGLTIKGPVDWPYYEAIRVVCDNAIAQQMRVIIIYGSTTQYADLSQVVPSVPDHRSYLSWQEIYTAMLLVNNDARMIQEIRQRLATAELVFFVGAPLHVAEVIDQVKAMCDGCLVILG